MQPDNKKKIPSQTENEIKVGFLVSYDYQYMEYAIPQVYEFADSIWLAIDKDRKTWIGKPFDLPSSFFEMITRIDVDNKIKIYEDCFHLATLTSMQCETRERNMLAKQMGEGGWHIQLDADEYFIDFGSFKNYLNKANVNTPTVIFAEWITMFRQQGNDHFIIDSNEKFPLATNHPQYTFARHIDTLKDKKYTTFKCLHQSWARNDEEISLKLSNWGHRDDFNTTSYLNLWRIVDRYTYKYLRDFHPLDGTSWRSLDWVEADNIETLTKKVAEMQTLKRETKKRSFFTKLFRGCR